MHNHNEKSKSRREKTNIEFVYLDRDDVDNAILEYIHKHLPHTDGMDIVEWNFKRGEVEVSFDLDTYEKLGRVSEREHNEALDEIDALLDENEQLQSDIEELESDREYLSGEVDGLNEEIERLDKQNEDSINEYEEHIDKLEQKLNIALDRIDEQDEQINTLKERLKKRDSEDHIRRQHQRDCPCR